MISRAQQILVKRAQREAGLSDLEYREALCAVTGCRSTTDTKITDRGVDLALAYFEAIYWRKVDAGELQPDCSPDAVFRQRGYWAKKNPRHETSRDRYAVSRPGAQIAAKERALAKLGFGPAYCASIRSKVTHGREDPIAMWCYLAALHRTLETKRRQLGAAAVPVPPDEML
jgi:hypothetical protein